MNKRYFRLKYNPNKQQYIIEPIPRESKIDRTKIIDSVLQYDPYTWVCSNKSSLVEKVEILKKDKLADLERQIKSINDRPVVIH